MVTQPIASNLPSRQQTRDMPGLAQRQGEGGQGRSLRRRGSELAAPADEPIGHVMTPSNRVDDLAFFGSMAIARRLLGLAHRPCPSVGGIL